MPYIEEVCVAGQTVEVTKYYSFRVHTKGEKRQASGDATSEAQKKINQRRAGIKLRRLMNNNFRDGDYLIRLDFHEVHPNTSEEMQTLTSNFIRRLKREYQKTGIDLKYIYVKELGSRGGRHIHLLVNQNSPDLIRRCWGYGGIHIDPLISNGQYRKIAEYFIKYASKTEETEGKLIGKRWYASRNLIPPKVRKKVITSNTFRNKVKLLKGYYLDADTERYGISETTGYEYFSYTLIKDTRGPTRRKRYG